MSAANASPGDGGVAVIGIGCRFPGADDPGTFWNNLRDGVESIRPLVEDELRAAGVPPDLLAHPDYVRAAPVLGDVARFDAGFFEYSPREAALLDPQQRLLLEVAWHAFEDAGYVPGAGATRSSGVFVGSGGVVTSYLLDRMAAVPDALPGTTGSMEHLGNDKDFLATRVSYKLGLTGPSINVQTACSTSLVAVHLACQSILSGECEFALAGASVVRIPHTAGYLHVKGGILSPDGHCRAFDAAARGTVFGSGVGLVLLRDLASAIASGDRIYAVIRGTAVNNDGAGKVSYTASSVAGQAGAMVEAMGVAGVGAGSIGFVECHGTGTVVGDPLEIQALTQAFRGDAAAGSCAVGSVKTNIGHLEQAAGVAALIKATLALHHGAIPPSLHFREPNPKIDFAASPFFVNTELRTWDGPGPRFAAVNSLGLGGTNAFAVLQAAPVASPRGEPESPGAQVLTLSARTEQALRAQLAAFRAVAARLEPEQLGAFCRASNLARAHHPRRIALPAPSLAGLRAALAEAEVPDTVPPPRGRLAFLFSGQGTQYPGMAAELYRDHPVFSAAVDRCAELLATRSALSPTVRDAILDRDGAGGWLDETAWTQPGLFVLQFGLMELWRSWGVVPDLVLGHSVGEFAAAVCAGILSLEDSLTLVATRGALMQALPRDGAMAAVPLPAERLAPLLGDARDALAIAAMNAPAASVVSGERAAVGRFLQRLEVEAGVRGQELPVSHAFHSPLMRPVAAELEAAARPLRARPPRIDFLSTVTGAPLTGAPDSGYWVEHALGSVRFLDAVRAAASGATDFIEIGPGATLLALGRQTLGDEGGRLAWLASLTRRRPAAETLSASLAQLQARGRSVDWAAVHRAAPRSDMRLPLYPFEPRRVWLEGRPGARTASPSQQGDTTAGARLRSALPETQFETRFGLGAQPWLEDHRIHGAPVLPTTAGLCLLQDAAARHFGVAIADVEVTDLQYREALVLPESGERIVQTILTPLDPSTAEARVVSAAAEDPAPAWRTHMACTLRARGAPTPAAPDVAALRARAVVLGPDSFYAAIRPTGLGYGPVFQGIEALWSAGAEALTRVATPVGLPPAGSPLHPALLDACLHIYPALAEAADGVELPEALRRRNPAFLPITVERFRTVGTPDAVAAAHSVLVHARKREGDAARSGVVTLDIGIFTEHGGWLGTIEGLSVRQVPVAAILPEAMIP
ncbi:MAG: type I polyketide synthase, partial [Acetobacteraceae bacterium]|nr:type I polyketide synthase [Acetobacteraceae bacterium]